MSNKDQASFTQEQSLAIIHRMIASAKSDLRYDGFYFLLWGWLVFLGSLTHYALIVGSTLSPAYAALPWIGVVALGVGGSIWQAWRKRQRARNRSYLATFMRFFWLGIGAFFFILMGVSLMRQLSFQVSYPIFMLLYGMGAFTTGGVIRFYPMILGGIASWLIAVVAFFVEFETQLLFIALAVLVSYLIPGYLLKRRA